MKYLNYDMSRLFELLKVALIDTFSLAKIVVQTKCLRDQ